MFGRFSSSAGLVGIDYGARATRLLQLREQGGELRVVGAGLIEAPSPPPPGGGLPTAEQVRAVFAAGGFTGRRCVVSLPRSEVRLQSVRMPRMPDADLRQAASWEAAQRFGLDREKMEVDFIRTGAALSGSETREEVLLVALPHEAIAARLTPLLEAGLRPVAVDTGFAALARFFSRRRRRESDREGDSAVRALLDLRSDGSTFAILRGPDIVFGRHLAVGGRDLDKAVADHLQMDLPSAAELRSARLRFGPADAGEPDRATDAATDRAIFEAVRPLLGDLMKEITLCLRHFGVMFRGSPPRRLMLSGSDSLEPRLQNLLEQSCKLSVASDDEDGTMARLVATIQSVLNRAPGPAPAWTTAAGLSIRSLKSAASNRGLEPASVNRPWPVTGRSSQEAA